MQTSSLESTQLGAAKILGCSLKPCSDTASEAIREGIWIEREKVPELILYPDHLPPAIDFYFPTKRLVLIVIISLKSLYSLSSTLCVLCLSTN